ncbi:MAG: tryptophan synthase subunit alpha [Casimicrobiaceae bacterium]|nr:tryptophan synthase subunit alpha [Casimicrobiaceae bacterium]MDW8313100.1 tryptophan synthase subunit alpha [Burkholderiales bacterium]
MSRQNRIDARLAQLRAQGRTALIPFITAGDPSLEATVPILHALARAGADVIELGVPFSDPMADGPVIQRSSERALARGMTLARVLSDVRAFRATDATTPLVLMGYANPIEARGPERFVREAAEAGVDGVLVVDYPPEEAEEFAALLDRYGLCPIFLLAPTSSRARIEAVARLARGYVYYVSLRGVTGASHLDLSEVARKLGEIRELVQLPIGVGFGIRDAETAARVAAVADAVVIGSALVQVLSEASEQPADVAGRWLGAVRTALDRPLRGDHSSEAKSATI